jgi:hypothetical protein
MLSFRRQVGILFIVWNKCMIYFDLYRVADISFGRLIAGKSLLLRRVVPILGVPDALVPLDLPVGQINLFPGYISD